MKLFYNVGRKNWYHTEKVTNITLGHNQQLIAFSPEECKQPRLMADLSLKNNNAGPLIGIMTAERNDGSIAGNGPLFEALQVKLMKKGGLSVVFTPEYLKNDNVDGYLFLPGEQKWVPATVPLPHLVYNRIPFRKSEAAADSLRAFSKLKEQGIPFFNPCFIDKYELYHAALTHPKLSAYFPETILIENSMLQSFLIKHKSLYLKPCSSSKGSGIYRLKITAGGLIQLEEKNSFNEYEHFHEFWETKGPFFLKKGYIAQKEIVPMSYQGNRFDFRILAHSNGSSYQVTGVGVRQTGQDHLTTHLLNGGTLIPYDQVRNVKHDTFINQIVALSGIFLSEQFGFFGEFSIDAGMSRTGEYFIFEINSKPMKFDEEEIENKRAESLCSLFFRMSGFE